MEHYKCKKIAASFRLILIGPTSFHLTITYFPETTMEIFLRSQNIFKDVADRVLVIYHTNSQPDLVMSVRYPLCSKLFSILL